MSRSERTAGPGGLGGPRGLAPSPGVDPTGVVKGQRFAVGPDPVWFCELGSQADRWPRAAVHPGDVIVADYVEDNADEHGNVMAAGVWTMVHARSLLALEGATAHDVAVARSWRRHRERLAQAAAEVLADLACAECGHGGADHRADHHVSHGEDGCTALADADEGAAGGGAGGLSLCWVRCRWWPAGW